MSQLTYNGVNLGLVKVNSVERTVRLSDDKTEYMWTDFIIDVSTVLSPSVLATSYPVGSFPEITDVNIRSLLMQPRRPLIYIEGSIPLVEIVSPAFNGGVIDCENGPTPLSCTITRIPSSRLFFVRFVVKASIIECPAGTVVLAVASSRYSRIESIDGQYRSTLTTVGSAKFRSNVLTEINQNADAFRGYLIPDPMLGFKRQLIRVVLDSSGIEMQWSTVDIEQFVDLGSTNVPGTAGYYGITEMDMEYQTQSNNSNSDGLNVAGLLGTICTVNAAAAGTKWANTFTMLQFLIICAINKLGAIVAGAGLPQNFSMSENIFKNTISMSVSYWLMPNSRFNSGLTTGIYQFVGIPILSLPSTGGIEPQPPYSNATRGFNAYQLAVNAFATACYTALNQLGGCDQSGFVPPDVYYYNGQCNASPQVVAYPPIPFNPPPDRRLPGKRGFRSIDSNMPTDYLVYDVREDTHTKTGMEVVPYSQTASTGGSSGSSGSSGSNSSQPTAGQNPGTPTMATLQLLQPSGHKKVNFAIKRLGAIPEFPDPTPTLPGYVLIDEVKSPVCTETGPDGYTLIYSISGYYLYGMTIPAFDHDTIPFSLPPWVADFDPAYNEIAQQDYFTGIVNIPPV